MTRKGFTLAVATALVAAAPAWAGNGHILHGFGATNSAMGGAGVALPNDAIGALHLNPALLVRLDGHRFEFSAELADAQNAVESSVATPVGTFSGRTEESGDPALIPAFGWTRNKTGNFAYGMGFIGLAGVGVDYPQDPRNPILAPQPQGFGRVYSKYELMKVPFAFAWRVSDALALGVSLNAGRASLAADPAGFAAPDCTPTGTCFVPSVNSDSAFGFGATVGLHYQVNDAFAFGASYSSEQDFEEFEFNSARANPLRPDFGTARDITFQINFPATATVGLGFTPSDRLKVALDAKMVSYEDTEGFGGSGTDAQGNAIGLGWEDIYVYAIGVQFAATQNFTLRAGYNVSENPIPGEVTFFNVISPAIFEEHVTLGLGLQINEVLQANLGVYRALENRSSGNFVSPFGPVPGTQVTNEMTMDSGVLTFSFKL